MKYRKSTPYIILAVIIIAGLFLGRGMGLFSIEANDHEHTVSSQKVVLNADWKQTIQGDCTINIQDNSLEGTSAVAKISQTPLEANGCTPVLIITQAKITTVDLSKYEKVIVRRTWKPSITGEVRYSRASSSLMGEPAVEFNTANTGVSTITPVTLGDVYITNDKTSIVVKSTEGTYLYDANQALYFTNTVSAGSVFDQDVNTDYEYKITGIEVTPFQNSSSEPPVTVVEKSWFQKIWSWIKGLWGAQ